LEDIKGVGKRIGNCPNPYSRFINLLIANLYFKFRALLSKETLKLLKGINRGIRQ
jgi:hypothetical protein